MWADKPFVLYRSSAGSGKTRTLAKAYLLLALKYKADYFRHILAVTFTNKATQEMKDRILQSVDSFANGQSSDLAFELMQELDLDEQTFRTRSQEVQRALLHHYSQFSISTIDAFFQRVIRSFTRETGLIGDYRLEVEDEVVLDEVINQLIDELGEKKELTKWVVEFARENLENERAWDVRRNLVEFAKEITKENFKLIEDDLQQKALQPEQLTELLAELRKIKYEFVNYVRGRARAAVDAFHAAGLRSWDFKWAGTGSIYDFMTKLTRLSTVAGFGEKDKGKRPEGDFQDVHSWPSKVSNHRSAIMKLAEETLLPLLNDILTYRKRNYSRSLSAELVLSNFYAFGLITDISRKLREYKEQNNLMLLSDAPKFLNGVINRSDTPFIYEKVGSFYRNFLIDEFQDTSGYQWFNFLPLLLNSLDQGYPGLVVGDVKQAIYRWRGGDLGLLHAHLLKHIGDHRLKVEPLDTNYRSAAGIVSFNNSLFPAAAEMLSEKVESPLPAEVFSDVAQKAARTADDGLIRIKFCTSDDDANWTERAMEQLVQWLEELQLSAGAKPKDIGILVRKNYEGQQLAEYLLAHSASGKALPNFRYEVISNESLRLTGAATVNLLVAAMRYLLNPEDVISRAQLVYEYSRLHGMDRPLTDVFAVTNQATFESSLPDAFTSQKTTLRKLPLVELTETLVGILRLSNASGELAFLQAFQDLVMEFYNRERNDLGAFLEWWEANKLSKSIQVSGDIDAISILTIHKVKGLQFKYVIVPFCSWTMDHEYMKYPYLWVKSDHAPFNTAGYMPVRYASALKETYFSESYIEEHARVFLDNLNLLYVAFTRAELGLMVMAPAPASNERYVYPVSKVLHACLRKIDPSWDDTSGTWSRGAYVHAKEPAEAQGNTVTLKHYAVGSWRDKLVIRRAGARMEVTDKRPILYGTIVHAVLSRIRHRSDLDQAIDGAISEGLLTHEERQAFYEQLSGFLDDPIIAGWFDESWTVRTEIPILLPDGHENRIDRLLTRDQQAIVIDYKTGEHTRADRNQVMDYLEILRKMKFTQVEGFLLYLKDMEVVPIHGTRRKPKKDLNQLELDI